VQDICNTVHRQSSLSSRFQDKYAVMFIGDALECAYRNIIDPNNKSSHLVGDFCKRWKIADASEVDEVFQRSLIAARVEAPFKMELALNHDFISRLSQDYGITNANHTWIPSHSKIGGKQRSITHTLRLLLALPHNHYGRLRLTPGLFGPNTWDELSKSLVPTIPMEMDELLMGNIMPVLINMCYEGFLSTYNFPSKQELLSLFCHIELFLKYPERPVTWTLAFAMHTILSSIFENQGSKHLSYIADAASTAFNQYFKQMQWEKETVIPLSSWRPAAYEKLLKQASSFEDLILIPMHAEKIYTDDQVQRALWNPVCAGCLLALVAYQVNVQVGSNMVDCSGQCRAWMHIYNALLQSGHISREEIPLLDFLYEKFEKCKAIWEGPYPVRGQFVTRWWISCGMTVDSAQKCSTSPSQMVFSRAYRSRIPKVIEPQSLARSYQGICMREYTHETGKYNSNERSQDWERLFNTLYAIEDDEHLLAFHWTSIGHYLSDAYLKLFNHCGWVTELDAIIESMANEIRKGNGTIRRMDHRPLKSTDLASESMRYKATSNILARFLATLDKEGLDKEGTDIIAENVSDFMKNYFLHLPLSKIQWFDLS
jgi:hypothetical protein